MEPELKAGKPFYYLLLKGVMEPATISNEKLVRFTEPPPLNSNHGFAFQLSIYRKSRPNLGPPPETAVSSSSPPFWCV